MTYNENQEEDKFYLRESREAVKSIKEKVFNRFLCYEMGYGAFYGLRSIKWNVCETQVEDNIHTFSQGQVLFEEGIACVEKTARFLYEKMTVAYTGCRYCASNCPMELDIPYLLKKYNKAKAGGAWRLRSLAALDEKKQPSACIDCGACTKHCPQGFEIPKYYMEEMKKMM